MFAKRMQNSEFSDRSKYKLFCGRTVQNFLIVQSIKRRQKIMAKEIEPKLKLISEYLKIDEKSIFSIPEYQRGYSWNNEQCDKLWQDIENFRDSDMTDPYFFGTIIVDCSETNKYKFVCLRKIHFICEIIAHVCGVAVVCRSMAGIRLELY